MGKLIEEGYTYASQAIFEWHKNNPDKFPLGKAPKFGFDLSSPSAKGYSYADIH
ncbi:hypothetical protein [Pseudoalteromonas phage J2-1_QLiu-2017]|nr:hypothetical protein [Pseudoalteromonas phage J2-1_QLiu-2017]